MNKYVVRYVMDSGREIYHQIVAGSETDAFQEVISRAHERADSPPTKIEVCGTIEEVYRRDVEAVKADYQ